MKKLSVKARIALWLTLLMGVLAGLLLAFMLSISSVVAVQTAMFQLSQTLQSNLPHTAMSNGRLELGSDFNFYLNGVSTLIYSREKALLAGRLPMSFTAEESFQNGVTRMVNAGTERYLVLDLWLPMGWENGVWIRGIMEAPENHRLMMNLLYVALIIMPVFMALAALGSYWIARKAFRPLDSITATAASINEAQDLSRRIGLPPGQDEFSQLSAAFDQLFQRLEKSFEAEKQFTADASHELRTPVSIIAGACEYAEKYDETLEERQESMAAFCVMGGIFSEGIDLVNEKLIGALIIGTGLPMVCREREILKHYFDRKGLDGFAYAYQYPGMNKVLQAAGRVIRTDEDRGVILLLDERFAGSSYQRLFPREWEQHEYCRIGSLSGSLQAFWNRQQDQK